jgi:hydrogen peroxide-dependent heme synthase
MNRQRLTPDFPDYPATCFYPMNKRRSVGANWFTEPFSARNRMMAEHARSGMEFAGRVSQLITVGVGLDDWEWGVTLWAVNPQFLKDIVYRMRFDEASAKYAEFGPFYTSYVTDAGAVLDHCRRSARSTARVGYRRRNGCRRPRRPCPARSAARDTGIRRGRIPGLRPAR